MLWVRKFFGETAQTHVSVIKASHSESGNMGSIPLGLKLSP